MFSNNQFGGNFGGLSGGIGGLGSGLGGGLGGGMGGAPFANQGMIQQHYNFGVAQNETQQDGAISIEVRKVMMGLTRPQQDQFRRTYDVVLDGQGERAIQDQVSQLGVEAFNPINMGNLMANGADFIRHSGQTEAPVAIEHGWQQDRYTFTLVVDVFRNGKFHRTEFVSGSTDYDGVNHAGMISTVAVDPKMVFTINHVTEARMRQMTGGAPAPMVSRANAVVRNNAFTSMGQHNSQSLYMTRPSDVLRAVDKVELYQGMREAAAYGQQQTYQDLDSLLTNVPLMSNDSYLLVPTFTSRVVKGLYQNSLNEYDPMNMDGTKAGQMAAQLVEDTPFQNSGFVFVMNRRIANDIGTTAQFTFGDLLMLDPTIDDRTEIFGRAYEQGSFVVPNGTSVDLLGAAETIAVHATSIAQTTLALMSLSGICTLAYNAHNMTSGDVELTFQACDGMDADGQLGQRLELLKGRLIIECLNLVCAHDETFEVDVFADAFNDVYIQIAWDGQRRSYVVPSFASSSLAPIVTEDFGRLTGMAQAISDVVQECKSILAPSLHNSNTSNQFIQGDGGGRTGGLSGDY